MDIRKLYAADDLTPKQKRCLLSAEENADLDFEPHSQKWWLAVEVAYSELMESTVTD